MFPRTFEWYEDPTDCITFNSERDRPRCKVGRRWRLEEATDPNGNWREVTPPVDIPKLDGAGVFHAEKEPAPEQPPFKQGDRVRSITGLVVTVEKCLKSSHFKTWIVCYDGDGAMDAADCTLIAAPAPESPPVEPAEAAAQADTETCKPPRRKTRDWSNSARFSVWFSDATDVLYFDFDDPNAVDADGCTWTLEKVLDKSWIGNEWIELVQSSAMNAERDALLTRAEAAEAEADRLMAIISDIDNELGAPGWPVLHSVRECKRYRDMWNSDLKEVARERDALRAQLAEARRERDAAEKKAAHSLANNLCPDHRDKQQGKPCLACEVETMARKLRDAEERERRLRECLEAVDTNCGNKHKHHLTLDGLTEESMSEEFLLENPGYLSDFAKWKAARDAALASTGSEGAATCTQDLQVETLIAELRRQKQEAWQRLDFATADRLAALVGDPLPSAHELAADRP